MANLIEPGQRMRWSQEERGLIKATFAEQEPLVVLVRKFLLQGKMRDEEKSYLASITSPEVFAILKKCVNPSLEKGAPAFQSVDMYANLGLETIPAEHAHILIKARQLAVKYLNQQFEALALLGGGDPGQSTEKEIMFDDLILPEEDQKQAWIKMEARNFLLTHIDTQLFSQLMIIAGTKEETEEEQTERLTRDSSM